MAFHEHLASLAGEYERLRLENSDLKQALGFMPDRDKPSAVINHGGAAKASVVTEASCAASDSPNNRVQSSETQSDLVAECPEVRILRPDALLAAAPPQHEPHPPDEYEDVIFTPSEVAPIRARPLFNASEDLQALMRAELAGTDKYDVSMYYYKTGVCQRIATSTKFENITMSVIAFYALWMAIDTDYNNAEVLTDAHPVFFWAEQFFCAYFFLELCIRFGAFASKRNCIKDGWFVFDTILVASMVLETWVMTIVFLVTASSSSSGVVANASMLRLARLMRLTRLLRMARLLRLLPELLILIKAISAAMRSVVFALLLLAIVLYVFAVGLTQSLKGTATGREFFFTIMNSIQTLFMHGTLLDECFLVIKAMNEERLWGALTAMYVFIILSAVTVMNMLIGVMCEVIKSIAAAEKEAIHVSSVKETLQTVLNVGVDDYLGQQELIDMIKDKEAVAALRFIGVDVMTIIEFADFMFDDKGKHINNELKISFVDFMEQILQLRGTNAATVKDLVDLRKWMNSFLKPVIDSQVDKAPHVRRESTRTKSLPKGSNTKSQQQPSQEDDSNPPKELNDASQQQSESTAEADHQLARGMTNESLTTTTCLRL